MNGCECSREVTSDKGTVLYIGGFELPDKNAAAQRVMGIAKGLRALRYRVVFLNSVKQLKDADVRKREYFDFKCYEYKREPDIDYLITAKTCLSRIKYIKPDIVIAYNYPGIALGKIKRYCNSHNIRCYADATEWYQIKDGNFLYRIIKTIDTSYRMRIVHKKMDGIIAISRFLYDYYKGYTKTVMIPPTVDITDSKWNTLVKKETKETSFVYAGAPSVQKEKLDLIVSAMERASVDHKIHMNILGINEQQFRQMYSWNKNLSWRIKFWGRVEHNKAIEIIKRSDWSIIIRDNNFVVRAGFPTKLVESISCGTPVIINRFSNVEDYLEDRDCLYVTLDKLYEIIDECCTFRKMPNQDTFDYRNYICKIKYLIEETDDGHKSKIAFLQVMNKICLTTLDSMKNVKIPD